MSGVARCLSAVLAASLTTSPVFAYQQHAVAAEDAAARLAAAAAERAAHRLTIDRLLSSPVAAEAASAGGLDIRMLRAGVASLSDEELRDLARRADALQTDPVAGAGRKKTLIIVGVVLVVVLLAIAIVDSCKEQGAECLNK